MFRFLRRLLKFLALFVGVALVYMAVAGRDVPPPDVSDLADVRPNIPPDGNAYTYFLAATNHLVWPKPSDFVRDFCNGTSTNAGPVRELVEANAETIHWIRMGVACKAYQSPELTPEAPAGAAPMLSAMGHILAAKAALERHDGHSEEAADTCILAMDLGTTVSGRTSGLIEGMLLALVPFHVGAEEIRNLARDPDVPVEVLRRLGAALATIPDQTSALQQSLRAEYAFASRTVDQVAKGFVRPDGRPVGTRSRRRMQVLGYFLQPNRTKGILAELFREAITNLERPYRDRTELDYFRAVGFKSGGGLSYLLFHLKPNAAVGARLVAFLCPLMASTDVSCRLDSELAATRLVVALNLHRIEKGTSPATLDALVPDCLEAVPADPYDGQPFRYAPDKQLVFSVGLNVKDDGGSDEILEQYRQMDEEKARSRGKTLDLVFGFGSQAKPDDPCQP